MRTSGTDEDERRQRNVRLYCFWGRIRRGCGRCPTIGKRVASRAASRGRASRHKPMDSHSARVRQDLRGCTSELEVRERAAAPIQQPAYLRAARQDARRNILHQRDGLYARPPSGLQRVAAKGLRWLGLGQCTALLQEGGEPTAWRKSAARRGWPTERV